MSMVGGLVNPSGYWGVMPPPPQKKNKGFFYLKKNNCLHSYSNIMTYAVKKCVFQYHEYDRRPGKSIGV